MSARLGHVPVPRHGETLSSILLRLSHNHVATAHEFCAMLWPGFQFWTRDIDRTAADSLLDALSRDTGLSREALDAATLRGLVEALGFPERLQGSQRGILPVGIYHRVRRRFGQQYCPACLAGQPPHLRRLWRLEILIACPEHGMLLRDACPNCDAPFIPHRDHSMVRRRCHHCESSLIEAKAEKALPRALMLQQAALRVLAPSLDDAAEALARSAHPGSSWPVLEGVGDGSLLDGIHRLCRLAAHMSDMQANRSGVRHETWALLRTHERAAVMELVGEWLSHWPTAWLGWAGKRGLSRHYLDATHGPWPAWVARGFESLPYSFGIVGIKRPRARGFGLSRRRFASIALWREARARMLLRRAGIPVSESR